MTNGPSIITPSKAFTHELAVKIAEQLQSGDEDWTYKVVKNPNPNGSGLSIIKIYDEDGEFVRNY